MQLLQPEIKEIQRKYKGDRVKQQAATQEFYKQRGIYLGEYVGLPFVWAWSLISATSRSTRSTSPRAWR